LRASLLAGALLDAVLTLAPGGPGPAVSYLPVALPALGLRAALQWMACYDLHRYRQAIPWIGLSFAAAAVMAAREPAHAAWAAAFGAVGMTQLAAWRVMRP
jgi:hypothetical protein